MNFWEARQAALNGYRVRMVSDFDIYDVLNFKEHVDWPGAYINSEWEIVEEPKTVTSFINVHPTWLSNPYPSKEEADYNSFCPRTCEVDRKTCIEIITDENGKLISARNV